MTNVKITLGDKKLNWGRQEKNNFKTKLVRFASIG